MPLIKKLHPSRDMSARVIDASLQVKNPNSERDGKDSGYEDFGEFDSADSLDSSDMEGSILHRPRPKKPTRAPTVPQRSDKRTSKLLADVMKELQSLDGSQQKELEKATVVEEKDPHEQYLSSEEDASLSDDYDDSLLDLDLEDSNEVQGEGRETTSRASSRRSQEDTARVVSFTFVKPQIINITVNPNSASNSPTKDKAPSTELPTSSPSPSQEPKQMQRPALKRRSNSIRRMSISSIASLTYTSSFVTAHSNASLSNLPPRKSSRFADLASLVTGNKSPRSHAFLNTDPFPSQQQEQNENAPTDAETPITPKTPTSIAASALKKGLTRTRGLGRARKPSMQRISAVYNAANNSSKASLSLAKERPSTSIEHPSPEAVQTSSSEPAKEYSKPSEPVRYEDIMKNVVRAPPPQPINTTPSSPRQRAASMFMGRRKSIKH